MLLLLLLLVVRNSFLKLQKLPAPQFLKRRKRLPSRKQITGKCARAAYAGPLCWVSLNGELLEKIQLLPLPTLLRKMRSQSIWPGQQLNRMKGTQRGLGRFRTARKKLLTHRRMTQNRASTPLLQLRKRNDSLQRCDYFLMFKSQTHPLSQPAFAPCNTYSTSLVAAVAAIRRALALLLRFRRSLQVKGALAEKAT